MSRGWGVTVLGGWETSGGIDTLRGHWGSGNHLEHLPCAPLMVPQTEPAQDPSLRDHMGSTRACRVQAGQVVCVSMSAHRQLSCHGTACSQSSWPCPPSSHTPRPVDTKRKKRVNVIFAHFPESTLSFQERFGHSSPSGEDRCGQHGCRRGPHLLL